MTKEIRSPNVEKLSVVRSPVSSFGFRHSFGFCHSSFGFEKRSLFNKKAGQRPDECGQGWVGSWRASFRFFACIGAMNLFGQFFVAYATKNCPGIQRGSWSDGHRPLSLVQASAGDRAPSYSEFVCC